MTDLKTEHKSYVGQKQWYVVLEDGETFSSLGDSSLVLLTEKGAERLCEGGNIFDLNEDELIVAHDLEDIVEQYARHGDSYFYGEFNDD